MSVIENVRKIVGLSEPVEILRQQNDVKMLYVDSDGTFIVLFLSLEEGDKLDDFMHIEDAYEFGEFNIRSQAEELYEEVTDGYNRY